MLLPVSWEEAGIVQSAEGGEGALFSQQLSIECQQNTEQYQGTQKVGEKDVPDGTPYLAMDGSSTLIQDLEGQVSSNRFRFLDALQSLTPNQADDEG
jgi:hypothetical protein